MPAKRRRRPGQAARPAQRQSRPEQARQGRPPLEVSSRRPELYDYQRPQGSPYSYNPYRDNTVEFPTGRTRPTARPEGQRARPARSGGPQRARPVQQGRRRPDAAPPRRREARRRRRLTHKMLRRRRMLRRLTAVALVLCVAAAGIYLTMTMLFKINAIRVESPAGGALDQAGPYTSGQILEALGVQLEENIFSFDPAAKADALEKAFPLLEHIEVERVYPSTVVVRVTPATPAYAMPAGTGWISLSADFKILSAQAEQPDLPVLYGGEPRSATPGEQLSYVQPAEAGSGTSEAQPEDARLQALARVLDALDARGLLEGVTRVEFADVEQLAFLYEDRISVLLGTLNELDYKMDYAEYMLLNKEGKGCAETDSGRLDCSHLRTDGSLQAIFAQGTPALPSGYSVPQAAPQQPQAGPDPQTADAAAPAEDGQQAAAQQEEGL